MTEYEYKVKSKLFDYVQNRIQQVYKDEIEETKEEMKTVTCRLPIEEFQKLGNVASLLQITKGELMREIIVNATDDIIREYKINFEKNEGETDE